MIFKNSIEKLKEKATSKKQSAKPELLPADVVANDEGNIDYINVTTADNKQYRVDYCKYSMISSYDPDTGSAGNDIGKVFISTKMV